MSNENGDQPGNDEQPRSVLRRLRPESLLEGVIVFLVGTGIVATIGLVRVLSSDGNSSPRITVDCEAAERIRPGRRVKLTYDVTSTAEVNVGLGAGFYDESGVDHARGTGDRDSFRLRSGRTRATRPFVVSRDLPAGMYELVAEVWPANMIGDAGTETLADGPCGFVTIS